MGAKDPLSLDQLADTYVILGELAGRDDARTYLGTRRADEKPVLITISREPA